MTQQSSATLDKIQIRYRISYLTWLRMQAWSRKQNKSMSRCCNALLSYALNQLEVPRDPAVLLGTKEKLVG